MARPGQHLPSCQHLLWLHPIFVLPWPPSVLQRKTSTAPPRIWSLYAFLSEQSLAMVGLEAPQKGMIASWGMPKKMLLSCLPTDLKNRKSPITTGQSCFPAIWRGTLGKGLASSKTCLRKQGNPKTTTWTETPQEFTNPKRLHHKLSDGVLARNVWLMATKNIAH